MGIRSSKTKKSHIFLLFLFGIFLFEHLIFSEDLLFDQNPAKAFESPSWLNFFGRDALGRDYSVRLRWAVRNSLMTCLLANVFSFLIAGLFALSGLVKSKTLSVCLDFISDVFLSVPRLVLFILFYSFLGYLNYSYHFNLSPRIVVVFTLAGLTWMPIYRLLVPILRDDFAKEYVQAGQVIGLSPKRLLLHEVFPNIKDFVTHLFVFRWASLLLFEGFLGFIGLGSQAPFSSWGGLIAEGLVFAELGFHLLLVPSLFFVIGIGFLLLVVEKKNIGPRFFS